MRKVKPNRRPMDGEQLLDLQFPEQFPASMLFGPERLPEEDFVVTPKQLGKMPFVCDSCRGQTYSYKQLLQGPSKYQKKCPRGHLLFLM